jgi:type II secretory ATPase GspE/PulE/Tfp pilus assembly ATPase PilB-like protein
VRLEARELDLRVSTVPTMFGESVVLRLLDRGGRPVELSELGMPSELLADVECLAAKPHGMLLVTGPTGSGKTTTLYSLLSQLNVESVNIMTLEDPVEYPVAMMRQTSVNEAAKMDFVNGIRSMMRQDPDIILVGEVRDRDTAEMAFRAAMTGHQVFTTLHTNSALGAFPRLLDIGILPDIIAGNIIGVIAQRLVRLLCTHCKEAYHPTREERQVLGVEADPALKIYRPTGCKQCNFRGYRGRTAIMEILRMDGDLDELVARRSTARELRTVAVEKGFRSLVEEGIARILNGHTSIAEVARSVDLTQRFR